MVAGRDREDPGAGAVFPAGGGNRLAADDGDAVNRQHVGRKLGVAGVVHLVAPGLDRLVAVRIDSRNRDRVLIAVRRLEPERELAVRVRPEIPARLRLVFDDDARDLAVWSPHVEGYGKHRLAAAVFRGGRNRVLRRIDRREAKRVVARAGCIVAVADRGRLRARRREHRAAGYHDVGVARVATADRGGVLSATRRHLAAGNRDVASPGTRLPAADARRVRAADRRYLAAGYVDAPA